MKFFSAKGLKIHSSSIGNPDLINLTELERAAWCLEAAKWGAWVPSTTDFKSLPDNTAVALEDLWNWDGSQDHFGVVRVEPILGYVLTFATSDLQKIIGAQVQLTFNFLNQTGAGYSTGGGYFPYPVQHSALLEFTKEEEGSTMLGIIPGQLVNGRPVLSLGLANYNPLGTPALSNLMQVTGLPVGTSANVRLVTRHDTDLQKLWPDAYEILFEDGVLLPTGGGK